ncbi:MAG: RNA polymerase factor sigma-54 [Campylobacter sp.]
MLKQKHAQAPKNKLSHTLRSWLPILSSSIEELKDTLEPFLKDNPFASVEQKNPVSSKAKNFFKEISKNSVIDSIEALSVAKESLYEKLISQIDKPLFPTSKSQQIAMKIIENINNEGYFEAGENLGFSEEEIEKVRKRFAFLEPSGVGAKDYKESFLFQLEELNLDDELYNATKFLIQNFDNLLKMRRIPLYSQALAIIKKLKNPPAIEYMSESVTVIPDIIINSNLNGIEVLINDEFYPEILIDIQGLNEQDEFISSRVKDAKDLIDALDMRKATLRKIALMIVEYQYDYFFGGDMKPMRLKDIAEDLGRNPSTISRGIANKYLQCSRGLIPIKNFFATALDEDISNKAIKDFILNLVKNENPQKPLSDIKILEYIREEFGINVVRRTITKYRKMLNIGSSSERKKIYNMQG